MKPEKFKINYANKVGLDAEADKIDSKLTKVQVYYFNVDLKFILKSRLFLLKKVFEENMSKTSLAIGSTYQCDQCEYGRMKEKIYSEVDANGMGFRCPQCKSDLQECSRENQLSDSEQKMCRREIDAMWDELKQFDEYVIPVKFFGPGQHSAYVGHTQ